MAFQEGEDGSDVMSGEEVFAGIEILKKAAGHS